MSVLIASISTTQAVSRVPVVSRSREIAGLGALSLFALFFPLVTAPNGVLSQDLKFLVLLPGAGLLAALLLVHLLDNPGFARSVRDCQLGLAISVVLASYTFLLCGLSPAAIGLSCFAPWLVLASRQLWGETSRERRSVLMLAAGFVLMVVVSCFLSGRQYEAITGSLLLRTGLVTFLACLVVGFAACWLPRRRIEGIMVLKFLLVSGFVVGGVAWLQFFLPREMLPELFRPPVEDLRPYSFLGRPNWFGTYLLLVLPFAIHFMFRERFWRWRLLVALLHGSLLVCQTRGAWLAEGVMLGFILVAARPDRKRLIELAVLLLAVTALLLPLQDGRLLKRAGTMGLEAELAVNGSNSTGAGRFGFWKYGLKHLPEHALLGAGLDGYMSLADQGEQPPASKAHSIYLEYALTTGVIGLICYLVFLWKCFWTQAPRGFVWAFRAMLLAYLVQGFFIHDTIQTMPILWLLAGLVLGPLARANNQSKDGTARDSASDHWLVISEARAPLAPPRTTTV